MLDLLIRNGLVVESPTQVRRADILVEDGIIKSVGAAAAAADRVIDASGRMVLPGFVTSHYHSHDVLLRGSFEPMPLEAWFMVAVPANYPKRSRAEIKARALLGALECLRGGITTVLPAGCLLVFRSANTPVFCLGISRGVGCTKLLVHTSNCGVRSSAVTYRRAKAGAMPSSSTAFSAAAIWVSLGAVWDCL